MSFHLDRGETLAILGESGSGKSVSASAVMNLIDMPPGYIIGGRDPVQGQSLLGMDRETAAQINGRKIAMIFQDPLAHLNPVYTGGWQISEILTAHGSPAPTRRGAGAGAHGAGRHPRSRGGDRQLSAPVLRRAAPAADDRHGAGAEAGHPDRRRADDRAGRDRPGGDPAPARGAAAGDRAWAFC